MRETPEPADDEEMFFCPDVQDIGFTKLRKLLHQLQAVLLIGQRLTMLQRQVNKLAFDRFQSAIIAFGQRLQRCISRQWIGGKGAKTSAKQVARKLVEHDDKRQTMVRLFLPVGQAARRSQLKCSQKAAADFVIKYGVFLEPLRATLAVPRAFAEPEGKYVACGAICSAIGAIGGSVRCSHSVRNDKLDTAARAGRNCAL